MIGLALPHPGKVTILIEHFISGETPSHLSVRIDDVCPRHYQLLTSWCCNHALRWGIYALPLAG